MEFARELPQKRKVEDRIRDYREVDAPIDPEISSKQAARCMDCGTPFCHSGCPLGNNIPEFNDAVYHGNWKHAYEILMSTNNFPEFTGRICPAPCEASCVLGINQPAVTIEYLEKTIIEKAFEAGYVHPRVPIQRSGKTVAVIGSGPAGLACAAQLNAAGHTVTVLERADAVGGLLRYGIPDFKLEKSILDRRIELMIGEGIQFRTGVEVGVGMTAQQLQREFDAVVLAIGSTQPRDLSIPGRQLSGIHFAMDFLPQQNLRVQGKVVEGQQILASNKNVIILGGGDTGADCLGTSIRQGAKSVTQLEILSKPPVNRTTSMPWPNWPAILRTSTSHEEGGTREWSLLTKAFVGDAAGNVTGVQVTDIVWNDSRTSFQEVEGTARLIPCDLVLLALGFTGPQKSGLIEQLGLALDERGNVRCKDYQTSVDGVFAAGDARRGQSLVVWAIHEGRETARRVDEFLSGSSVLESRDTGRLRA